MSALPNEGHRAIHVIHYSGAGAEIDTDIYTFDGSRYRFEKSTHQVMEY